MRLHFIGETGRKAAVACLKLAVKLTAMCLVRTGYGSTHLDNFAASMRERDQLGTVLSWA